MELLNDLFIKPDSQFTVGTVITTSPLTVKIFSTDDAISCYQLAHISGLVAGTTRVLLLKYQNKYIAIGAIA